MLKISIITAVRNAAFTIADCIESIQGQTYPHFEHIIIDGASTDNTLDIIRKYSHREFKLISESDKGIYDAINKGIKLASGDIIGILHADDFFADNETIGKIAESFANKEMDSCYGDLIYVQRHDKNRIVRYWHAGSYNKRKFRWGWMPPHPTFFVKRSIYDKYGLLNLKFPLAADYELMLRFLYKYNISTDYIPRILVKMRTGGTSKPGLYTLKALIENYNAWKINDLRPNPLTFIIKPLSKTFQYVKP